MAAFHRPSCTAGGGGARVPELSFGALAILTLVALPPAAAETGSAAEAPRALEIFVSPDGSDEGAGTAERPFASLERARDAIRALKEEPGGLPRGGVTVRIRGGSGGIHPVERTVELTAEDSGTPDAPIVYRAAEGEEVRLVGGRVLRGLEPVDDPEVLGRLVEAARGKVLRADMRAQGILDLGRLRSRGFGRGSVPSHMELFFGGKRMTLARWPNEGYVTIAGIGSAAAAGDGHGGQLGKLEEGFRYEGDRPDRWKSVEGVWVHGFWAWDWANSYEEVASIDRESRLVLTKPPHGLYGFRKGQRFYFLNVLEELDAPGEYFVDAESGILYFWPPAAIEGNEAMVSILESPIFSLGSSSHVEIRGITIECSRGLGVRIAGGESVLVAGCTLRNLGNYAVSIEGGKGHGVVGCDIYSLADGGVSLEGGDRRTLEPSGHLAENNHVHHLAEWSRCYFPAFLVGGVGARVAHNLVHDHPHCPILFTGNEHVIELNEIHHVCLDTGDVGAIYTGRDWTYRGNVIRHNFIHHTGGVGMGSMGVYLDDCVSGETIFGNVFYKVQRAAFIGGGRDHTVVNNIFVECNPSVAIDGRGLDGSPVWRGMVYETMKERLEAMRPHEPPYSERYPELRQLDAFYAKDEGVPPGGIVVARNISVGGPWLQIHWHARPEMVEVRDNLVDEDPRFVDPERMDFRLRDDSPAFGLGFRRIPFEEIGLRRDEHRKAVPGRKEGS